MSVRVRDLLVEEIGLRQTRSHNKVAIQRGADEAALDRVLDRA